MHCVFAQIPEGYYNDAIGKSGNELRVALHHIIKGHTAFSYGALWSAYYTTDVVPGTDYVWDIYSDNPSGETAYYYVLGEDQCSGSSPSAENQCYNREHLFPQSKFSSEYPMYSDLWIVYPTDAFVNAKRANYPYGEVAGATYTSSNGSKLGANTYPGAPSTLCFEPHDSFKGDIARSYFYISTRYYGEDAGWSNWEMANGAELKPWAKDMLLAWHHLDPVSEKERERNEAVYALQHNRNPFIDYPEMADCIFGTADCTELLGIEDWTSSDSVVLYPNPASTKIYLSLDTEVEQLQVLDYLGKQWMNFINFPNEKHEINVESLPTGNYILRIQSNNGYLHLKFSKL